MGELTFLLSSKNSLLFCYLFSYYMLLLLLVVFFFSLNIKKMRFLTELSFYSNCSFLHLVLVLACISLAGLPPLFFFFVKFSLVAVVILQNSWYLSVSMLVLIFLGWFLYLTVVKLISNQSWSFSASQLFGMRHLNTGLALAAVLGLWLLVFGFFFLNDVFLAVAWMFCGC
jgi:NADH:ubiquinone oxidoreductase subunit 2 (subunit N)